MEQLRTFPAPIRRVVVVALVLFVLTIAMTGFNAYMTLAAPSSLPYVPDTVGFEGQLTNSSGQPVADGNYTITFSLYEVPSGGTVLWSETQSVAVSDGLYSVQLGSVTSMSDTLFDASRYLGIQVSGDSEMTPRIAISAVPFALNARQALGLQGNAVSGTTPTDGQVLTWDSTGDGVWYPAPSEPVGYLDGGNLDISSDAISISGTNRRYTVDTEYPVTEDILSTISGGINGDVVLLTNADQNHVIMMESGTGNLVFPSGHTNRRMWHGYSYLFRYDGTNWELISDEGPVIYATTYGLTNFVTNYNYDAFDPNYFTVTDPYSLIATTAPYEFVCPEDGIYLVSATTYAYRTTLSAGDTSITVYRNGTEIVYARDKDGISSASISYPIECDYGDRLKIYAGKGYENQLRVAGSIRRLGD